MSSSRLFFVFVAGFIFLTTLPTSSSHAQTADTGEQSTEWAAPAISAAQRMRMFPDPSQSVQQAPPVIRSLKPIAIQAGSSRAISLAARR
jgi:hypothetical protein